MLATNASKLDPNNTTDATSSSCIEYKMLSHTNVSQLDIHEGIGNYFHIVGDYTTTSNCIDLGSCFRLCTNIVCFYMLDFIGVVNYGDYRLLCLYMYCAAAIMNFIVLFWDIRQ